MKIAVLGTGNVGRSLGIRSAQAGHQVCFGSRDPGSDKCRQLAADCPQAQVATWQEAAEGAELVLLAVPWSAVQQALAACGELGERVIVDCINPLKPDLSGLDLDGAASTCQRIADWAPGARIVKAFNSVSAATMADPHYDGTPATLFFCGDDEQAKQRVARLGEDLGFEPVDAGPLSNASHLESLAMLYIHLAINGWGSNCAFKILKR